MPSLDEIAASAGGALNPLLDSALANISGGQTVTFTKYTRLVLPLDGFAFWVKSSLLGDATAPLVIHGSLHLTSQKQQDEFSVSSREAVVFSSKTDAGQAFSELGAASIYIGQSSGKGDIATRFTFSRLGYYENAGLYHYSGMGIYQQMYSQIVDTAEALAALPDSFQVVSNSLPSWLLLSNYTPSLPAYGFGNTIPLFPSQLSTFNLVPPYGTVHIAADGTEALAPIRTLGRTSNYSQLARDRVRVTFYGAGNDAVMNFIDCVLQFSQDYGQIGIMNAPVVRDDKEAQTELSILALRKSVTFEVSYYQSSMRDIARKLIATATCAVTPVNPAWPVNPAAV